jgi:hypothetical protein
MSHDFDVIGGTQAPTPPKIKPAAPPSDAVRRSSDTEADKIAAVPKEPPSPT